MHPTKSSLLAMLAVAAMTMPAQAETIPARITITGEGRVSAQPDIAMVSLGVATRAPTAAEALRTNSDALGRVLAKLQDAGIADRDLQTSGLSLGPQMDYSRSGEPPRIVGYEAGNMLAVRVRDLTALGGILDAVVTDGANTLNGLSFDLADPGPARDAARVQAVEDARRKAALVATAAGVGLGRIIEITEQDNWSPPRPMMRDGMVAAAMEAVPIAQGEVSYSVAVTITWELAQD